MLALMAPGLVVARPTMSVIDEIKERLDIVEVISTYVPLKKAGRNYKGLCPFHGEKTPSFVVFPDTQGWHCFGACATGGDVFSFVMKRENLDFGEALAFLANKAGVELMLRQDAGPEEGKLERLRAVVADAAVYYHYLLHKSAPATGARQYLEHRGLTTQTWETWQLGYALDSWDDLKDRLIGKGYSLAELEEAGLVIRREDQSGYYDRFRGRLMIPIRDSQGRTIGFGARLLVEDPERPQPKYINSPQTPLFDKGSVLYGLDMARRAIREANLAVIVEGYMDVLGSHQAGVMNVVAGMGTALGEAQMRQLKRYTGNITLALDPDAAGDHATLRGLETARQSLERDWENVIGPTGLVRQESRLKAQLRIASLPDGLDPDELALQDPERWRRVIADARPIVDYYLALVMREEDLTTARGKANAVNRMAPLIREIANPVERDHYTQLLARLAQADERLVAEQVAVAGRVKDKERRTQEQDATTETVESPAKVRRERNIGLEEHLLGQILLRPDLLSRLDGEMIKEHTPPLGPDDFFEPANRAVMSLLQQSTFVGDASELESLLEASDPTVQALCRWLLVHSQGQPPLSDEKLVKELGDSLIRLRERNLQQRIRQIEHLMLDCEQTGATGERRQYQELMVSCTAQLDHLHELRFSRSMIGNVKARRTPETMITGSSRAA
jgi:DNA primase